MEEHNSSTHNKNITIKVKKVEI